MHMYRDFWGTVAGQVPQPSWPLLSEIYLSVISRLPAVFPSNIPCLFLHVSEAQWTQHLDIGYRHRKNALWMHNSLNASWMCCTHRAWVQSWSICGLQVKLAHFHVLALMCQAHYACALLYLCPPFTEAFPHSSTGAHNLQSPIQLCLPKSFLGPDYDLLWQIFSVNNTANRKRGVITLTG